MEDTIDLFLSTDVTDESPKAKQCKICPNAVFDNKALLTKHIKKYHKKDNKYVCNKCTKTCNKFFNLVVHYKNNHSQPLTSTGLTDVTDKSPKAKPQCKICPNAVFDTPLLLREHNKKYHKKNDKYACHKCDHTCKNISNLAKHYKSNHSQPSTSTCEASTRATYECKICYEYVFKNRDNLRFHIEKHHKNYVCHKCKTYKCKTVTILTEHVKTCEHPQPSTSTCIIDEASTIAEYQCEICYCICENKDSLKMHKEDHILYACNKCNYENKDLPTVKKHVKDKHVQPSILTDITDESTRTKFLCKICDASFKTQFLLSSHKKEHHTIYACANCPYMDKALYNVTRHVKLEHPQPSTSTGVTGEASTKAKYQCEICYRVYEKKKFLHSHINQNHKYCACNKCTYIVISKKFDTLINHVKLKHPQPSTSTSEASTRTELQCKICDKTCRNTVSLRLHYNTCHKKNNKFVCTKCEYTSKEIRKIVRHMESYHSPTSIYCVVCDTYFYTKYEYITHQEVHRDLSELDKFKCPKCNKKYEYFSNLEAHYNRMHFSRSV